MDSTLKTLFKAAVDGKKDSAFQDIVDIVYSKRFGPRFVSVKQKRDKGCDGIVDNSRILAAYAPEKSKLKDFKKKFTGDFEKYQNDWQADHPHWECIYNGEFTAQMIQHLNALKPDCVKTDINRLLDMIGELPHFKRRELAIDLSINEQFIINDALKAVIEDLFKLSEESIEGSKLYESPPYIEDKIRLNYDESDIEDALKEYEHVVEHFGELKDILKSYQDFEIGAVKTKLISSYGKLSGNLKDRLESLTEQFSERNKNDDYYIFFVRVVLIYFFEICVIGRRPESENDYSAA
ncbi:MAG: hypothetical protein ACYC69_00495 [Thermodesulfovibrionales bacterium]